MTNSSSDESQTTRQAAREQDRRNETIVMERKGVDQRTPDGVATRAIEELDGLSHMLDAAQASGADAEQPAIGVEAAPGESDEPTIEEYMAGLLARSRDPRTKATEDVLREVRAAQAAAKTAKKSTQPAAAPEATQKEWSPSPAPECREAISELRELANISARSSFNVYRGQRLVFDMHGKLFVALVAMLTSGALLSVTPSMRAPTFFGAVVAMIAAVAWGLRYFSLSRQLARLCFTSDAEQDEASSE